MSINRATQPGPVSPGGGEQAQRHKPASLSPQPTEANVKDNGFPWPPQDLLGILRKTQFLRYYSVREAN